MHPGLREWIRHAVSGLTNLEKEIASMMAMMKVIDGYFVRLNGRKPERWQTCIVDHLEKYKLAYPDVLMKPEHHLALHLPSQIMAHDTAQTTLVHERKHRHVQQQAAHITNTTAFEKVTPA